MTYEIKRLDLLSVFKISFLVYLVVGFLFGLFYGLFILRMITAITPLLETDLFKGLGDIGVGGIFMMAIFMAFFGAGISSIFTVIGAAIYNVCTGWVGGLKIQIESFPPQHQQVAPPLNPPQPPSGGSSDV
ncbi:MAG: DUF3566 domain-containing protein [bacterium]|nr:DUF3566 domain-containing protein [bacterium]